jgi:hypothetical protein
MKEPLDINELLFRLLENEISDEDLAKLEEWLYSDPSAIAHYYHFIHDYSYMSLSAGPELNTETSVEAGDNFDKRLWALLAEHEKTAPAKAIKNGNGTPAVPVEKIELPQSPRKANKISLMVAMAGVAALLFILLYFHFTPYPAGQEVATMMDSIGAEVSDSFPVTHGARLSTYRGSIELKKGILSIRYDLGVDVIIEGPASFDMVTPTEIVLHRGKIFTQVSESGRGFAISTQNSKIIDLGTQFGVIADTSGDTEVHVFKGETMLVAGAQKEKKTVLNLTAGKAGKICAGQTAVKNIQVNLSAFVRDIDSKAGFVWRGESTIPLTNLLAGGIFNASPSGIEIDPAIGKHVVHENYVSGTERGGRMEYQKMDSPFVDGTFVPLGEQPQIISSTNLSCQFPKTSGSFHFNLSDQKIVYDGYTSSRYPLSLTSTASDKPSLFLHPNMGVTFDLNKLRQKMPVIHIQRFRADCGIASSAREALKKAYPDGNIPEAEKPSMDFVVLLDGKACQTLNGIHQDSGIMKINVDIQPTDRFLTLVATDGNQCFKYDWFLLSDPVLEIAAAQ